MQSTGDRLTGLGANEFDRLRELMADVPDLRLAKVMKVRRAIATRSYNEDASLTRSLPIIENEIGVLCRSDD